MRRVLIVAAALLSAAALGAVAAGAHGSAALTGPRVIHVVEHPVTDQVVDIGRKGDSPGDQLPFANPIYSGDNTHRVGSDQGNCVRASSSQGRWECMWTTFLGQGQITVEGPFLDAKATTVAAVTGGTGEFRNARGQMILHLRADGNFDFVFELRS